MPNFTLPSYSELFKLNKEERKLLMYISLNEEHFEVESTILRSLAFAVATKSSDVHFNAKITNGYLRVSINIRTKNGFVNHIFNHPKCDPVHFQNKLLQLTNNTIGGTQAEIISSRFSLDFPSWWAQSQGLICDSSLTSYKTDIRVQFQKTFGGFSIVCRILDQQCAPNLNQLGLTNALNQLIKNVINQSSGLVIVSGPTGSGKTTLLNAMLCELNDGTRSIFTIENPVEFRLAGNGPITQVQTHGQITFAAGLRSALRSDPDVILIGEIRDPETMEVALQAAQTGHLVLASIHASSAAQTISRMLDLTVDKARDAYRVSDTLKLVLAQRLIDKYTTEPEIRALSYIEKDWLNLNGLNSSEQFQETRSNLKIGVTALIEAISIDHEIKKIIREPNFNMEDIYSVAKEQLEYETLAMCGLRCVERGESKLYDCMVKLESNQQASSDISLRSKLVNLYNLNYSLVSKAIDQYIDLLLLNTADLTNQKESIAPVFDFNISNPIIENEEHIPHGLRALLSAANLLYKSIGGIYTHQDLSLTINQ